MVAGIRPERLRLTRSGTNAQGVVHTIENLGSEELVHIEVGPNTLCARAPRPVATRVGEDAAIRIEPDDIHLFDRVSGHRLIWQHTSECSPSLQNATLSVA